MVIKVYVAMISYSQEVKKNQQRALMILESKNVPFVTIDITDPGSEDSKDYMNENARPKGDNKIPQTPQIFNEADYCGDYDELDMANECDTLGEFLKLTEEEKKKIKIGITGILPEDRKRAKEQASQQLTNGVSASRENEVPSVNAEIVKETPAPAINEETPTTETVQETPAEATAEVTDNGEAPIMEDHVDTEATELLQEEVTEADKAAEEIREVKEEVAPEEDEAGETGITEVVKEVKEGEEEKGVEVGEEVIGDEEGAVDAAEETSKTVEEDEAEGS